MLAREPLPSCFVFDRPLLEQTLRDRPLERDGPSICGSAITPKPSSRARRRTRAASWSLSARVSGAGK
ncbi:MAG TPA: hypothetical protein VGM56_19815 [Byssovorax sp.]